MNRTAAYREYRDSGIQPHCHCEGAARGDLKHPFVIPVLYMP
jgi:hypothetical protein